MDIRIGAPARVGPPGDKTSTPKGTVEARILAIRQPRRRRGPGGGQPERVERRSAPPQRNDPPSGRVLILMIPDAGTLPPNLEGGAYRVFLRFVRR